MDHSPLSFARRRTAIYVRFATDEQGMQGTSRQIFQLQTYAFEHNYDVVEVYEDIGAGTCIHPRLHRLMQDALEGHIDAILVTSFDRFGRDPGLIVQYVGGMAEQRPDLEIVAVNQGIAFKEWLKTTAVFA